MAERMAEWAANGAGCDGLSVEKKASDLGFCESRLSESNRRPIHYEVRPDRPSQSAGVRCCRSAGTSVPRPSADVRRRVRVWLVEWLTEPRESMEPAPR